MTALITVIALALSPQHGLVEWTPNWTVPPEKSMNVLVPVPHERDISLDTRWTDEVLLLSFEGPPPTTTLPEPEPAPEPDPEPPPPTTRTVARALAAPSGGGWVHAWITDEILNELGMCESTNNYQVNTGNGFYGRVQWLTHTWNAAAARADRPDLIGVRPDLVAPADQDYVTKVWWSLSDYRGQWPVCGPRAVARAG